MTGGDDRSFGAAARAAGRGPVLESGRRIAGGVFGRWLPRRYNAACNHCHGPDGAGSSFAPSLVEHAFDREIFRRVVLAGKANGVSVMEGFGGDPNVAPHVDDIYDYLKARAEGAIGRGRPSP